MHVRRRILTVGITAALLAVPTAALAQDTGIGDSDSVECTGSVSVAVVDLDGAPVPGAVLMVGGQQVSGSGTVTAACGELTAALLVVPDGYAPAGPTEAPVRVQNGAVSSHTFTVDPVEVLGTQFEQPEPAPEQPATQQPAPQQPAPEIAPDDEPAPTLPETGPAEAEALLLAALLLGLLGTVLVGATPSPAALDRRDVGR